MGTRIHDLAQIDMYQNYIHLCVCICELRRFYHNGGPDWCRLVWGSFEERETAEQKLYNLTLKAKTHALDIVPWQLVRTLFGGVDHTQLPP